MIEWGSGSTWWGGDRLIGNILDAEAELFEKEGRDAFEIVEKLYKEWAFKLTPASEDRQI